MDFGMLGRIAKELSLTLLSIVVVPMLAGGQDSSLNHTTYQARSQTGSDAKTVFRGTVNIVLGNTNGIVALTDSQQTGLDVDGTPSRSDTPSQKLFRIDDQTVCTIAGFASVPLPGFPDFINSAAGIMDRYISELHDHPGPHSFQEKLTSLAFLLEYFFEGIENLQTLKPQQANRYEFDLILAGYDLDGTPKINKLTLTSDVSSSGYAKVNVSILPPKIVRHDLEHETAGIGGDVAENILKEPQQFKEEKAISRYAVSLTDRSSLTASEMRALASSLARHASNVYRIPDAQGHFIPLVGGSDQVAILNKGQIEDIDQPDFFKPRPENIYEFGFIMGLNEDGGGIPGIALNRTTKGEIGLYLRMTFANGLVNLDRGYFYGDKFVNTSLFYRGGDVLGFQNNDVNGCTLILGPLVDHSLPAVQELLTKYHWKDVQDMNRANPPQ
ncbi:MAG: hypothetical protein WB952_19340 [Terriglobales bacterium]